MPEKQISKVLKAVQDGFCTSHDIAEEIGLSVATVSNYLTQLADDGLIQMTYRRRTKYAKHGPRSHWYAPA